MSTYSQPSGKRQKVRDSKGDVGDYFQDIDKIEYNNMASPFETTSYRYYQCTERVYSRSMEDWLKYSVSFTEFRSNGSNNYGRPTHIRPWDDNTNTIENHKRCIKALFDFCIKLGVQYWTAFDTDLVPWSDSWDEVRTLWDEMIEYILDLGQRYRVKCLWIAPDLQSHPRYTSGAFTSNDATTFVHAAIQIKKCLEMSQRLNSECFLLWPYREGYDTIFQTEVSKEIKLFAKLLKMTAEYKDRLNYRYQLLIMPCYNCNYGRNFGSCLWQHSQWRESDIVNKYMWDITSCLYFLKNYSLDRHYKVCSPPGHHMYMANVYNVLGGVIITSDIDQFDSKQLTLMMKCIVDQGTTPPGGINLKLIPHRDSDLRDLTTTYSKYIDSIARGLRVASSIIGEQIFAKHLQVILKPDLQINNSHRYISYYGFGSRLVTSDISMEECEEYNKKNQNTHSEAASSKYEHMDLVFQRYLDTSDHI